MQTAVRSGAARRPEGAVAARPRSPAQELVELRRLARVGVAAALLAPVELVEHGPVLCPFRRATGQPCPSCGLSRSWTAVAHGRIRDGFRMHPLGPPAFVAAAALSVVPRRFLDRVPAYPSAALPAFAFAWVGVWLARMIASAGVHTRAQEDVHAK